MSLNVIEYSGALAIRPLIAVYYLLCNSKTTQTPLQNLCRGLKPLKTTYQGEAQTVAHANM